jgi:HlyD family secretion protein
MALVVVIVAVVMALQWLVSSGSADSTTELFAPVERGRLMISISESGAVKSRQQIIIKSEVEGRPTILYLIDEGTDVKKGDLLVELDASDLEESKISQQITVQNAEASLVSAETDLGVTKSQSDSDVASAELDYSFAQLDLEKYIEGEYPNELKQAESDIALAQEELEQAKNDCEGSRKLEAQGYITQNELKSDELALKRAEISLTRANNALRLLQEYTHKRKLAKLESDVEQMKAALERVKSKAAAEVVQAQANLRAKQSEYDRQKAKLEKTIDQIAKCRIVSPVDAMVVYSTTGKADRRGNTEPLAEGQEIRERQELIYLPTASAMSAEIKIQESSLRKVAVGMPVKITVDALPDKTFYGKVSKIGLLPDAQSMWMNPDLTVYSTEINLQGDMQGLRPGMTCRAEIIVDRYEDALYLPIQAVTRVDGKPTVYVQNGGGSEARAIETGLDNNRFIRVISGLDEGEMVSLAPPLQPSSLGAEGENSDDYEDIPEDVRNAIGTVKPTANGGPRAGAASGESGQRPGFGTGDGEGTGGRFGGNITDEQRRQMHERFANMTDEERAAMRERFGGGRGGRRTGGENASTGDGSGSRGGGRRTGGDNASGRQPTEGASNEGAGAQPAEGASGE